MNALQDTWHCSVEEQVAMCLQTVGHKKHNWDIKFHFTRSAETVSGYFNEVLYAIGQLGHEMLKHRQWMYFLSTETAEGFTHILRYASPIQKLIC
jgi:hypothetical protein